jgi:hypothetical protein
VAKIVCPRCKSDATKLPAFLKNHSVAYCEHCGWNIPAATARVQTDVRAGWLVSALGLVLVGLAWRGPWGFTGAVMIGVAFLLLPASMALLGRYRLSRIKLIAADKAQTPRPSIATGQDQSNSELDRFCLTPRPRRVKMSWLGRLYVFGVGAATVVGTWLLSFMARALLHPPPGATLKLVFGVVVYCWWCWICFAFFRNRIREKNLFVSGEYATGTVATRTEGSQGAYIVYAFQATSGRVFQNRVFDFSKNQFEQMPLHVF